VSPSSLPTQHPSGVIATLVKMVFFWIHLHAIGVGLLRRFLARRRRNPIRVDRVKASSLPGLIQAISSPTVETFQPLNAAGGSAWRNSSAHAEGNAALT